MKVIDWNDFESKVSKYFTVGEVCKYERQRIPTDNQHQLNVIKLANELDKLREAYGQSALIVNSWYRPARINKAVGGVSNSQHIKGLAADIHPADGNLAAFQSFCLNNWTDAVGKGLAKGFVHLDVRYGGGYKKGAKPKLVWTY